VVSELALVPSFRTLRRWGAAAAVYTRVFVTLGAVAGWQIWLPAELHRSLLEVAAALTSTARAVGLVGEVPMIGAGADQLAGSITDTAAEVGRNAVAVRGQVHVLAVVVGVAVVLLLTVPLVAVSLPRRVARAREVAGLQRKLAGWTDPMLVEHVADAALSRVPFAELRHVSGQPWQDVEQGRHRPVAVAELTRLGLRPPAGWAGTGGGSEPDRG
jgi:hypothetical protein